MRTRLVLLTASAVLVAATPAGAVATKTCRSVVTPTGASGPVHATRVGCKTARLVAHAFANTGKAAHWTCVAKPYGGGATITCHKGSGATQKRVRFQTAD